LKPAYHAADCFALNEKDASVYNPQIIASLISRGNSTVNVNNTQIEIQELKISAGKPERTNLWQEFAWLSLIFAAGLLSRLIFITSFPSHPISNFFNTPDLAILFRYSGIIKNVWHWHFFSPGLSLILSIFFEFIPKPSETIGRWATAISTGLVQGY